MAPLFGGALAYLSLQDWFQLPYPSFLWLPLSWQASSQLAPALFSVLLYYTCLSQKVSPALFLSASLGSGGHLTLFSSLQHAYPALFADLSDYSPVCQPMQGFLYISCSLLPMQ